MLRIFPEFILKLQEAGTAYLFAEAQQCQFGRGRLLAQLGQSDVADVLWIVHQIVCDSLLLFCQCGIHVPDSL